MRLSLSLSSWLVCLFAWRIAADNNTQPISIFRSRPDLSAPILSVFRHQREKLAPGYYFVAPYQSTNEAIHIYDNDANLVYSGFGSAGPGVSHAPQTCMYKGEVHLCFYQGVQMLGWGHGHGLIMDKHYRIVKSVEPGSYQASSDMHEFRLINDGRQALLTQYLRSVYDLCPWDLCDGLGYIQQGAFQEVDVDTGDVLFEWHSLDHVDAHESWVPPGTTEISGSGEHPESPWDYFHINSIDKNQFGDYLISARHTSALYKLSGVDGHVIWRLNGAKSDYVLDGFHFSSQHDARFISDNETHTVLSLFDNGTNGFNQTQPHSTGQIIVVDHTTKVATAILNLDPPFVDGHAHISKSQGSMQILPNGGILMGWGNDAFWTEYAPGTHEIIFYGALAWTNTMNYRVHKFDNWVGMPLTKPAIWTFSKEGGEMMMYVSWNGATEVKSWRFYGGDSKQGPWEELGQVPKRGFESFYRHPTTHTYNYAEALDKDGHVLGTSAVEKTFIPNAQLKEYCDDIACRFMPSPQQRQKEKEEAENARLGLDVPDVPDEQDKLEAERQRAEQIKNAEIYGGTFGGLVVLIILIIVLATRNVVSRPVHALAYNFYRAISRRSTRGSDLGIGAGYKALALEEQDGDRAPMIRDPS
ncbi:hypothetical protein A1O7_07048 [Cladophialophora yegresii CBS 114405]|uniref:ASST-domain-containing protein n=1 Tax=Cladophialophora yegresii CBS 114405 TaxID=1182544 RepID=W9WDV0_9EURO|nr:uncharacterized protein A1O7_07048 [Cladophialophora yegresii CBS 114405]EXJ56704.1 hypothetical protein A1O7_07048 [Cladophialophora yegresii CBS 114405]